MVELLTHDFAKDLIVHVFSFFNIDCNINLQIVINQIPFICYSPLHARIVSNFLKTKGSAIITLLESHLYTQTMDENKFTWCSFKVVDIISSGPISTSRFLICCSLLAVIAAYSVKNGYQNADVKAVSFILYAIQHFHMSRKLHSSTFVKDVSTRTLL